MPDLAKPSLASPCRAAPDRLNESFGQSDLETNSVAPRSPDALHPWRRDSAALDHPIRRRTQRPSCALHGHEVAALLLLLCAHYHRTAFLLVVRIGRGEVVAQMALGRA